MENDEVIQKLIRWSIDVVERPTTAFGGLPVCPFAKRARVDDKIRWEVVRFAVGGPASEVLTLVADFDRERHDIMIIVNPEKTCSAGEFFSYLDVAIRPKAQDLGLDFLGAHPDDPWEVAGHRTEWPYPCCLVSSLELLGRSSNKLLRTRYYEKWSQANLDYFNIPLKSKVD